MKFRTTIKQTGKNTTGIEVPVDIVTALNTGKKPAVIISINGKSYRNSIASMGGVYMISLSAENRELTGTKGGDMVDVTIELDTAPRTIDVPEALAMVLKEDKAAQAAFDKLSNSKKQLLTIPIEQAKTDETRQRRVEKAMEALRTTK